MEQDRIMQVSMLLDDELSERDALSVLDQIEFDDRLRAKWFRYNAASLALKSDSVVALQPDLVERVRRSIASDQGAPPAAARPRRRVRVWPVTAFAGALAAYCAVKDDIREGVKFASAAGALVCTKFGGIEALPSKADIIQMLQREDIDLLPRS